MDEAEQLCDQLVIVDRGQIIAEGTPKALLHEHFDHVFVCLDSTQVTEQQLAPLQQQAQHIEQHNGQVIIKTASVEKTLQTLIADNIPIQSLQVRNPTLDDLFLKLTGHSLRE